MFGHCGGTASIVFSHSSAAVRLLAVGVPSEVNSRSRVPACLLASVQQGDFCPSSSVQRGLKIRIGGNEAAKQCEIWEKMKVYPSQAPSRAPERHIIGVFRKMHCFYGEFVGTAVPAYVSVGFHCIKLTGHFLRGGGCALRIKCPTATKLS